MSKSIYLDSNDFSDLSAPEDRLKPDDASVLTALRKARRDGSATILLSPPLLSEAVHASETSKEHALRRASLMRDLCGKDSLLYPTDVCKLEFDRALSGKPPPSLSDIVSGEDKWFGTRYDLQSLHDTRKAAQQKLHEHLNKLPRDKRRKLKSQLNFFKASSRPLLAQLMKEGQIDNDKNEFPFNMINQNQYVDWLLGGKTDFDLHKQLREMLSDPYLLFKHLVDEAGLRDQLYSMTRGGGQGLVNSLDAVGNNLIKLSELAVQARQNIKPRDLADELFFNSILTEVIAPLSDRRLEGYSNAQILELLDQCPSASILAHVLREYTHTFVQANFARFEHGGRTPTSAKRSDFGDLMHIFYAPYVDIFRCDARFGEHLKSHKVYKSHVAARRTDILRML
jgi:hypothetical protein